MKNLLIMRHAKSDWNNQLLSDSDRPLNERGLRDAPSMGRELINRNKNIDLIISSTAIRAQSTAQLVSAAIDYKNEIQFEESFYASTCSTIQINLELIDKVHNTVLIVGHNPTVESLIYNFITEKEGGISMSTAAIASINFNIDDWADIEFNTGTLEWLIKPKDFY